MKTTWKKLFSVALTLGLVFAVAACATDEPTTPTTPTTPAPAEPTQLVVGSPEISGEFLGGFGNSAYDVWVRNLVNGYGTVAVTPEGEFVVNETVVADFSVFDAPNGDRTYSFRIHDDLVWNDGRQITAADFVYSVLMQASKEWVTAGASSTVGRPFVGYTEYRAGATSADVGFRGVQLNGDFTFSVTIDGSQLPYFYELSYASVGPLPTHVFAPGVTIQQTTDGAKVGTGGFNNLTNIVAPGGYRFAPRVTAGPYNFISFVNQVVRVEINPTFKGDYRGHLPSIDTIIIRSVNQLLDVDLVISEEIDMVTGVIEGAKIQAAQAASNTNLSFYSRNGYGLLAMTADFGPTTDYRVRQAVALITDRQYVTDQVLEGYGSITFSEYGLAQWMYVESQDWVEDNLNPYNFSVNASNDILDTTDWRFESNGTTPFDRTKATLNSSYFRHNAAGDVLQLRHFGTENNPITDSLQAKFEQNMQLVGAQYDVTIGDFAALLNNYYAKAYGTPDSDRQFHIFNLASNFAAAYVPFFSWNSEFVGTFNNPHGLADSPESPAAPLAAGERTLDELTVAMRLTEPGDRVTYIALWREYQLRWNKLMPNVPLYSNQYYDVYNQKVKGVATTPFWNWSIAVIDMSIEE